MCSLDCIIPSSSSLSFKFLSMIHVNCGLDTTPYSCNPAFTIQSN